MSKEQLPLPIVTWSSWFNYDGARVALTLHAEAQHSIDCLQKSLSVEEGMRNESDRSLAVMTAERDAALADAQRLREALARLYRWAKMQTDADFSWDHPMPMALVALAATAETRA